MARDPWSAAGKGPADSKSGRCSSSPLLSFFSPLTLASGDPREQRSERRQRTTRPGGPAERQATAGAGRGATRPRPRRVRRSAPSRARLRPSRRGGRPQRRGGRQATRRPGRRRSVFRGQTEVCSRLAARGCWDCRAERVNGWPDARLPLRRYSPNSHPTPVAAPTHGPCIGRSSVRTAAPTDAPARSYRRRCRRPASPVHRQRPGCPWRRPRRCGAILARRRRLLVSRVQRAVSPRAGKGGERSSRPQEPARLWRRRSTEAR